MYRNTYIEIDLDNFYNNASSIIKSYKGYEYYMGVVKSNCYGHGSYCVKELIKAGVNYLAVSNLLEAKNIRKINKSIPILCLEPVNLNYLSEVLDLNLTLTVSSLDYLKELKNIGVNKDLKVHLKINSGMNRLGFSDKNEVVEAFITAKEYFDLEGVYSHFATLGYLDKKYKKQIDRFKDITSLVDLSKIKIVHMGKSSSLINHDKLDFCNGIRLGIVLYGINIGINKSSNILRNVKNSILRKIKKIDNVNYGCKVNIKNTLSLYSEVIEVNSVLKNEYVGYGFAKKLKKDSRIAIISIGYADGIKTFGKNRYVYINKKRFEILSVSSGMLMVMADKSVKIGDVAEVYGKNANLRQMARKSNTNSYDLLASLHESIPRVYIKNEKKVHAEVWEVK